MSDLGETQAPSNGRNLLERLPKGVILVLAALAVMWILEIIDTVGVGLDLDQHGVRPRSLDGLDGILWSPFLHGGFGHLISNTIPFVLLSGLVLARGRGRWLSASAVIILIGGLLVWLFALDDAIHIGASGWVFGLFGYLVASAWFERRPVAILTALVAMALYGTTIIFGFLPKTGVSWEGHLFGFIAGVLAGRLLTLRGANSTPPEPQQLPS